MKQVQITYSSHLFLLVFLDILFVGMTCQTIPPLQHGNSSCTAPINETTGTNYSFFFQNGFNIKGSTSRTCLANYKWNGTMAQCESKLVS